MKIDTNTTKCGDGLENNREIQELISRLDRQISRTSCPSGASHRELSESYEELIAEGIKYDADKVSYQLLPWEALEMVARVFMFGAKKYAPDNWRKVPEGKTRYVDAAMRHLVASIQGSQADIESGHFHLAHAAASCLMALGREISEYNSDTRPPEVKEPGRYVVLSSGTVEEYKNAKR